MAPATNAHAASPESYAAAFAERLSRIGCQGDNREPLLRVLSLNAAHGRSDGPNQVFQGSADFRENLASIGKLLRSMRADVVALQEVDGPSAWSGRFDHAASMADDADYPWHFRADHATSWLFRYGTAVLSRLPINTSHSHRFAASPPSPRKGFVISEVVLPVTVAGMNDIVVDVVSVHFDFLSRRAQASQVAELIDVIGERDNPAIVLGDFNSTWQRPNSIVRRLTTQTGLTAYKPESPHFETHGGERIDWILISDDFRFSSYRVLSEVVSDHQPVYAEISLNPDGELALPGCARPMRT